MGWSTPIMSAELIVSSLDFRGLGYSSYGLYWDDGKDSGNYCNRVISGSRFRFVFCFLVPGF